MLAPVISTPLRVLLTMTLPLLEADPPMVFSVAPPLMITPSSTLPMFAVDDWSVPIQFAFTWLPIVVLPSMDTPFPRLLAITLPPEESDPPMVLMLCRP